MSILFYCGQFFKKEKTPANLIAGVSLLLFVEKGLRLNGADNRQEAVVISRHYFTVFFRRCFQVLQEPGLGGLTHFWGSFTPFSTRCREAFFLFHRFRCSRRFHA